MRQSEKIRMRNNEHGSAGSIARAAFD